MVIIVASFILLYYNYPSKSVLFIQSLSPRRVSGLHVRQRLEGREVTFARRLQVVISSQGFTPTDKLQISERRVSLGGLGEKPPRRRVVVGPKT